MNDDAENESIANHTEKNGNLSVNDTEGRWPTDKIYLAHFFIGRAKGLIRNMTGIVYHCLFITEIQKVLSDSTVRHFVCQGCQSFSISPFGTRVANELPFGNTMWKFRLKIKWKSNFPENLFGNCRLSRGIGRLPFDQKFRNFRNRNKWEGKFLGKVPENPEIVEFPKSEPFSREFRKFRGEACINDRFTGGRTGRLCYTEIGDPSNRRTIYLAVGNFRTTPN